MLDMHDMQKEINKTIREAKRDLEGQIEAMVEDTTVMVDPLNENMNHVTESPLKRRSIEADQFAAASR